METEYTSPWPQSLENLCAVSAAGEELLRHAGEQGGEAFQSARKHFEKTLDDLKQSANSLEARSLRKARLATQKADLYVQEHPWTALGAGAAAAGLAGVLLGLALARR